MGRRAALGVVMAAGGYPESYEKGDADHRSRRCGQRHQKVFHAGTSVASRSVATNGGRVLCVVGLGASVAAAADQAYEAVGRIHWDGAYFRPDIGHRAIAREKS